MSWHSVGAVIRGVDLPVTQANEGFFSCRWNRKGDRAQPDDLLEDPFGLELGLWEWSEDGPYASEIKGPNGKRGVPPLNFAGWFALTTSVTLGYQCLQITGNVADAPDSEDSGGPGAERAAALLLLSYYLPAAVWALKQGRRKYLLYSTPFATTLCAALKGR